MNKIPLTLKILYTAFMLVLVPVYWTVYGPTNFLFFCDAVLFLTLIAMWSENKLVTSIAGVGIILPQLVWFFDFVFQLIGIPTLGMTSYMFDDAKSVWLRALSLFHAWMPFLLLYMIKKLGYDPKAFGLWTAMAWILLILSFVFSSEPGIRSNSSTAPVNVNYVFGFGTDAPQQFLDPYLYLGLIMVFVPTLLSYPMHLLLKKWFG